MARRPFHWPDVVRSVGLASDARKLILAMLGLILTRVGIMGLDYVFGNPWPASPLPVSLRVWRDLFSPEWLAETLAMATWLVTEPPRLIVEPLIELLRSNTPGMRRLQAALACAWILAVWGLIGGAIARIAVVQTTGNGGGGVLGSLRFALRRWLPLVGAPLGPFLLGAMFATPAILAGLVSKLFHNSPFVAGLVSPVAVVCAAFLAFLLIALVLAWPLMHLTVAAEGEDIFDAISRSFSYVNQRLIRYTTCLILAWLAGSIGLFFVFWFASMVLVLSMSLLSVFGDLQFFEAVYEIGAIDVRRSSTSLLSAIGLVGLMVHAWAYSYFWSALSVIYLMLRRDVDGTPWHDVYLESHEADEFAPKSPTLDLTGSPGSPPVPEA
ncbi:hypothetical protein EP7_001039 [Isosphaeraceae bacterium EP7]